VRQVLGELARLSEDGQVQQLYDFLQCFLPEAQLVNHQTTLSDGAIPRDVMPQVKLKRSREHEDLLREVATEPAILT